MRRENVGTVLLPAGADRNLHRPGVEGTPAARGGGGLAHEPVGAKQAGEPLLTWSPETTMSEGTPRSCKGALGTWRLQESPDTGGPGNHGAPVEANHRVQGCMWVSAEASRCRGRRPQGGQGQHRPGESPPSGIAGGPAETWTMVELGTHLAYRKSECWKLSA